VRGLRTTICCSLTVALALTALSGQRQSRPLAASAPSGGREHPPRPRLYFPLSSVWSVDLPAAPEPALALDETSAYISLANGELTARSLVDGKPRWTIQVEPSSGLTAALGLVFLPVKDTVEAHSATDGALKWRTTVGGSTTAPLVCDGGWLIAATDGGELIALRAEDGAIVWRSRIEGVARARSALAADRLFVPLETGDVLALALTTGALVWQTRLDAAASDVLALDDRLFVGSKDNWFYCLDAETGRRRWRMRAGADVVGAPVVDQSNVYFVSMDNVLRALNRHRGNLTWMAPLPLRPTAGPLMADDLLIVAGQSVNLRGFRTKDGHPVGEYGAPADLVAPPGYVPKVEGLRAAPILVLLLIDEAGTAHLEAVTSELPTI
jgi:outer membrane protein assembly factor BamB